MRRVLPYLLVAAVITLAPATSDASRCTYVVEKGDTLSQVARRHGVSEKDLIAANPALSKNPNRLRVGQQLQLCKARGQRARKPGRCGEGGRLIVHEVRRGDTLGGIAARYSVSRDALRRLNPKLSKRDGDMIRVAETLDVCTEATQRSWLVEGVPLPQGEGYNIRRPDSAWGTKRAVEGIVAAIDAYTMVEPDAPLVQIGDISRKNGGPLHEHKSHQEGRDVDIGVVWERDEDGHGTKSIDLDRTWSLVRSFAEADGVAVIFIDYQLQKELYEHALSTGVDEAWLNAVFEYPRTDGEAILYHWPGHARHFHVRFERGPASEASPDAADVELFQPQAATS